MVKVILPTLIFSTPIAVEKEINEIKSYGADGIEIRRERLIPTQELLQTMKTYIDKVDLSPVIYSVPEDLWMADGRLNDKFATFCREAAWVSASYIKFSLGNFSLEKACSESVLKQNLQKIPGKLLVENNQTKEGGSLAGFVRFFKWNKTLPVSMTFDTGNWMTVKEDAEMAYEILREHIEYMHIKDTIWRGKYESIPVKIDSPWFIRAAQHQMAAVEFPFSAPADEGPKWVQCIKGSGMK